MPTKMQIMNNKKYQTEEITSLFELPFNDLMFKAQTIHRENFPDNQIQMSTLLSIKTGGCQEDCKYCSQSFKSKSGIKAEKLMKTDTVLEAAKKAKESGSNRFCMGAAWRNPKERDMPELVNMVKSVKGLGLETCMTLGMLDENQAEELKIAGLDYYNHNIDTSEEYYDKIITSRTFQDRLDTLQLVRDSGIKVCSGGIIGMGESIKDRAGMIATLANLEVQPESIPINKLVPIKGTDLENTKEVDNFDFIRTIAVTRIVCPKSFVRLSAGRESMSKEVQALCFMAGANSIFYGDKLLTTGNAKENEDIKLLKELGLQVMKSNESNKSHNESEYITQSA